MKKIILAVMSLVTLSFTACTYRDVRPDHPGNYKQLITYAEEFDNNAGRWAFSDGYNYAYGVVSNGTFKFDYNDNLHEAYYLAKDINFNQYDDFTLYTRIGSDNNMGLLFGYNSQTNTYGYSFTVDYDGYYALYDEGGNGYGPDIQEVVSPATGNFVNIYGDWNELRLEQRGNRWIGYINDVRVFNIPAQKLNYGSLGFVVVSNTQGEADYIQADWYE